MAFEAEEKALKLIELLQPLVMRIRAKDRSLAEQLTRAGSSVALNLAESNYSDAGNRRARLFTAAGSTNEVHMGLRVAVAWRYCAASDAEAALGIAQEIRRILWKLTH